MTDTADKYHNQDIEFFRAQNNDMPTRQPEKLVSGWIDGRRIMPTSSPFPGVYDISKTPYIVEMCDNMSPYSDITGQAVKKGVQIAITTAVENCIAYYWKERPRDQMYLTGTEDLYKRFNTKRLPALIDSVGLKAAAQYTTRNTRRTGETTEIKEYIGGSLVLGSLGSSAHARSDSIQIMYIDEIDLVEPQMASGEGNILRVLDGRLVAFGERAKSFSLSTPRLYESSLIDIQYKRGDQRKFHVSCPRCKKTQWLCQGSESSNYGLKGDTKAGVLQFGYYLCFFCHDIIFNSDKPRMLSGGIWLPSVERAPIKNHRSYHIPSFYSPMMTFTAMYEKYIEAVEGGDDGMRSYTNLYLGKSFKPSGERPKFQSVIELRSTYNSGVVPAGVLYLTAAGDVQQGTKKYWEMSTSQILDEVKKIRAQDKWSPLLKKIPRLEIEVVGHGSEFRTASIIYKEFYGRIDDETAGAWEALTNWMRETDLKFKRKDGYAFNIKRMLIDSGYGRFTDLVYNYCEPFPAMYACKGDKPKKQDKLKLVDIDEMNMGSITRFKLSKSGAFRFLLISVNYYKRNIYRLLKNTGWSGDQPPNSHQTPSDYPDSYFKGLTAEEQKIDGSFHNISQRPNEPLDLLVYNKAASDFWIEDLVLADRERLKRIYKQKGRVVSEEELRKMSKRSIITARLEAELIKKGW